MIPVGTKQIEVIPKRFLQSLGLLIALVLISVFTFRLMDYPLVGVLLPGALKLLIF